MSDDKVKEKWVEFWNKAMYEDDNKKNATTINEADIVMMENMYKYFTSKQSAFEDYMLEAETSQELEAIVKQIAVYQVFITTLARILKK